MTEAFEIADVGTVHQDHPRGWRRYVYATNPLDLGKMYLWLALFAGLIGGGLSSLRGAGAPPDDVITLAHGLTMVVFMVLPALFAGFGNALAPLMIGASATALPRLNAIAFWLMGFGLLLLPLSVAVAGDAGSAGHALVSAGPAADLVIFAVQLAAISTLLTAINFIATILNLRAPGLTLAKLPLFVTTLLLAAVLLLLTMPVLAAALAMLLADRHFATGFFAAADGAQLLPLACLVPPGLIAVLLPGFGIVGHVAASFTRRPVCGRRRMIAAMVVLGGLGCCGWVAVFLGPIARLLFFAAVVLAAAVPVLALTLTLWRRPSAFSAPLLFAIGFVVLFTLGCLSGVALALPGWAGLVGTAYAVAHWHFVFALSAVFAIFAGWYFWFAKFFGWLYNEVLAKIHFWLTFAGTVVAFLPLFRLGWDSAWPGYRAGAAAMADWHRLAALGAAIAGGGVVIFFMAIIEAFAKKRKAGDNPWGVGATGLEWSLSSPPPYRPFNEHPKIT